MQIIKDPPRYISVAGLFPKKYERYAAARDAGGSKKSARFKAYASGDEAAQMEQRYQQEKKHG